jgi:hypothetical protein
VSVTCSVYGLGLSVNVPLAGLRGLAPAAHVDVSLQVGGLPEALDEREASCAPIHVSDERDETGKPVRIVARTAAGHYRIEYCDGTRVIVDERGARVWAQGGVPDVEDTATYLLGPVLGFVLRLRGVNCLHASAVAIDDRACAFVGPSGSGKSSMAAAFARGGYAVMSDDVTPVTEESGGFLAQPAYPRLRLWPESVERLFGDRESLPAIVPGWDKRHLDLGEAPFRFQREPLPLAAIYLLDDSPGPASIAPVPTREAVMSIVADTYATYLLDRDRRAKEFDFIMRLVEAVPVRRLRRGDDLAAAARTCEIVAADMRARRQS